MSFTKEHFIEVAEVLRKHKVSKEVIEGFVAVFVAKNPRFQPALFRDASTHPSLID
tara:strand:+ start:63 stop:230 length:168 start_codon:yes stop_codon:yes gene_type:complete